MIINSSDIDLKTMTSVVYLNQQKSILFLKLLLQMGYSNLKYNTSSDTEKKITGLKSKRGNEVTITIKEYNYIHQKQFYISCCFTEHTSVYYYDDLIIYESKFWRYMSEETKKRAENNFRRAVKKYLLSPEEMLVKDIIE